MSGAHVFIDHSQFPQAVRRDLIASLQSRRINHKFHYESYKQAAKWLALHEAYSPARRDESCARAYDVCFEDISNALPGDAELLGLGCGGGQKEARFLEILRSRSIETHARLSDVSLPLVLTAWNSARRLTSNCEAIVCDLGTSDFAFLERTGRRSGGKSASRIVTLFGIIPNFEPHFLFSRIAGLLQSGDTLLFSANLAPGQNYADSVGRIAPQYDNPLTRDWLMTLLLDVGFESDDGELRFEVIADENSLLRVAASFTLRRARTIRVVGETIEFAAGESLQVFFSYRHTLETIARLASQHGLHLQGHWLNDSMEEGVFACVRK